MTISDKKSTTEAKQYSPLTLAYLGDAVYEIYVRQKIVLDANMPKNKLHNAAVQKVKAGFQAVIADKIEPMLTDDEHDIYKRGRNASTTKVPKGSNRAEYHKATGLETLIGYLYISGNEKRISEIMEKVWEE